MSYDLSGYFYAKIANMGTQIVFMGSPDFAASILDVLSIHYPIVGVVTQPDRPAGRGRKISIPPVKSLALELSIPVIQPSKLSVDKRSKQQIIEWNPTVIVVAAFGQILKTDVLEIAPWGSINVHASLLPRWRGVSPIQAAILNGDKETGITIMKMDEGIDTGDIISQRSIPIFPDETGGSLYQKLTQLGGELLVETLPPYLEGEFRPKPQGDSPTPYAPMIKKSDGLLDFNEPAEYLERKVRAYHPWPGTYTFWKNKNLKIIKTHNIPEESPGIGIATIRNNLPAIGTKDGLLVIEIIQPSGKRPMSGDNFLHGVRDWENYILN
jgi:methionyl-tRNA formyltransferase